MSIKSWTDLQTLAAISRLRLLLRPNTHLNRKRMQSLKHSHHSISTNLSLSCSGSSSKTPSALRTCTMKREIIFYIERLMITLFASLSTSYCTTSSALLSTLRTLRWSAMAQPRQTSSTQMRNPVSSTRFAGVSQIGSTRHPSQIKASTRCTSPASTATFR